MVGAAIKMNRAFCSVARHDEMQLRKGDFNSHPREVSPEVILSRQVSLPPLNECRHFVNLTNGLEIVPTLEELNLDYSFIRIQSTSSEQSLYENMMQSMDANLLANLALGHCCLVYDFGSRMTSGQPSALWKGMEFARFALRRYVFDRHANSFLKGHKVTEPFALRARKFSETTKNLIRYHKRFVPAHLNDVQLYGIFKPTSHDEDKEFYSELARTWCTPSMGTGKRQESIIQHSNDQSTVNAREFWEQRGFGMHAGGVCQSLNEGIWDNQICLSDVDHTNCSFPLQAYHSLESVSSEMK